MDLDVGKVFFNRNIRNHWIWKNPVKFQWWVDLVMSANYKDTKDFAKGNLFVLKRGQLQASIDYLARRWDSSRPTIIGFLKLLEKDGMIKREVLYGSIGTITICNYDSYQIGIDSTLDPSLDGSSDPSLDPSFDPNRRSKEVKNTPNGELPPPNGGGVQPPKKPKKPKKNPTLITKGRQVFEAYFKELYGENYYWTAKDAVAMKQLFNKIRYSRANRASPLPVDEESLCVALHSFLESINKSWIMDNFSVTKINSQYNDIIAEIKNKNRNNENHNQRTDDRRRGTQAVTHTAEEYKEDV